MIKKVNVKKANALWILLTLIPYANGFILMSYANSIFEKRYKFIGLGCSLASIVFVCLLGVVVDIDALFWTFLMISVAAYLACIVSALLMKNKYKYRKGVLKYADTYHVLYNDFETAENEVVAIVESEKKDLHNSDTKPAETTIPEKPKTEIKPQGPIKEVIIEKENTDDAKDTKIIEETAEKSEEDILGDINNQIHSWMGDND